MIGTIFETITESVRGFASCLGQAFSAIGNMFYNESGLTMLGTLSLIAVGVAVVYFAYRVIKGLIMRA